MKIFQIVEYINELGDMATYRYDELRNKMDEMIDEINRAMSTCFPVFSELPVDQVEYNYFPDRYIRNVVCYGVISRMLRQEDDLESKYQNLWLHCQEWLETMVRDYSNYVDPKYRIPDNKAGFLQIQNGNNDSDSNSTVINPMWIG